jgi:ribosome biogenesis GTPase
VSAFASPAAASSPSLADLGWDDAWAATLATAAQLLGDGEPGRVARIDVGACTVFGADGPRRVGIPSGITVAVGDWVVVQAGVVGGALPRRTAVVRRSAGLDPRAQTLAANVDTVLVLIAADGRVTPRSVERYVTLVWESGATPVVVLTKADLVSGDDLDDALQRLEPACVGVTLLAVSVPTGAGLDDLASWFGPGRTVALLGSSGAGKSTLANHLTGASVATGTVRGDGRGRHTTTHRELMPLPGGGVLVDTPGLREVGLWQGEEGVAKAFPEITALVDRCRFTDCTHRREPGCAVLEALADGRITDDRLAGWRKLRRELDRLAARDDPALRQQLRTEQRRVYRGYAQTRRQWRKPR